MTIYSALFESHETLKMSTVQPGITPAFWRGPGFMTQDRNGKEFAKQLTFATSDVEFLAKAAVEKGLHVRPDGWGIYVPSDCELFILDFEPWYGPDSSLFGQNFEAICEWMKQFRKLAPGVKTAIYPFNLATLQPPSYMHWMNLVLATVPNGMALDYFKQAQEDIAPLVGLVDVITPDCYMLSPASWRRDIQHIHILSAMFRRFGKPICPFITPRFSGRYNKLTMTQCRAYWRTLSEACDGAVVWGLKSDANNLLATCPN